MSSSSGTELGSEAAIEPALIDLADRFGLPLVATNEPYFAARSDYEAHDALLCVAGGRPDLGLRPPPPVARAPVQDAAPR